jgi:broad specificity phosphatase PhoE
MPKLILIKHAHVEVAPELPPDRWHLSEKGKLSCKELADRLAVYTPFVLVSSEETKAMETAAEIARELQMPSSAHPGLEEHDRSNVPVMQSREFISMVELFFRRPEELVLGREMAAGALSRFRSAIDNVITEHPDEDLAIVSHGSVIALLLAEFTGKSGFGLWRSLGLPSFAVLSLPDFQVIEAVERI